MLVRLVGGLAVGCATAQAVDYHSNQQQLQNPSDILQQQSRRHLSNPTSSIAFAASPEFMKEAGKKKLYNAPEDKLEQLQEEDPAAVAELEYFEQKRDRRRTRAEAVAQKVEVLAKRQGVELDSVTARKRQTEAELESALQKNAVSAALSQQIPENPVVPTVAGEGGVNSSSSTDGGDAASKSALSGLSWKDRKKAMTETSSRGEKIVAEGEDLQAAEDDEVGKVNPVQLVIVGGGLAAGRLAALMDSIVDVTIIDSKNYAQFNPDVVPLFASPWGEGTDDTFNRCMYLHRYYLKRSKVMTAKAVRINPSDQVVHLNDGRCVPYDALVFATGSRRAFPFTSSSRTKNQRKTELHHFNTFLGTCKRVAVVGGGPMGVSTAGQLAAARPDLQVVLYHSHPALLSTLPLSCRHFTNVAFKKSDNLTVELSTRVTDVHRVRPVHNTLNGTAGTRPVPDEDGFKDFPLYDQTLTPPPAGHDQGPAADGADLGDNEAAIPDVPKKESGGNWFSRLIGGGTQKKPEAVSQDPSLVQGGVQIPLTPWEEEELKVQQQWTEQFNQERANAADVDAKRAAGQARMEKENASAEDKYVLDIERLEGGMITTRSILYQWYFRSRSDKMTQGDPVKEETTEPFDYVFTCTGGTPYHQPLVEDELVASHLHSNGKFKSSKAFQLMGQPHIFALGSAANMPWEPSYIHAIMNVRFLFFQLYQCWTRAAGQDKASTINSQSSNVLAYNSTPRLSVNLGNGLFTGANDAGNPCSGVTGFSNYQAQRSELLDALLKPKRFKPNPPGKVRAMFDQWRKQETTDVSDFEFIK